MRFFPAVVLWLLAFPVVAQVTITTTPATPAWGGEMFTFTVRGSGCLPEFQSVVTSGNTIRISATVCDCPGVPKPYVFETTPLSVPTPGIYIVEYHTFDCNQKDTLVTTQLLPVAFYCQFDRALSATAAAARVGESINLHWCDPSVLAGPDEGVKVTFFRVLMSRSVNGPFVAFSDVPVTDLRVTFSPPDIGSRFFFVEAHQCTQSMAVCTGDTVVRSNVIRIDVAPQNGCLPDATTLCLNGGRFQVQAQWQTSAGNIGPGQAVPMSADTGNFWFFGADNVELVVKVLNGCALPNPSYWVFASGLTNVGVDLTVTDTKTGIAKTYRNPVNQPFVAIQDTAAFATCP
jgi:hypothetical protein